jgi:UrcA family protein
VAQLKLVQISINNIENINIASFAMFISKAAMAHISGFANVALHKQRKEIPMKYVSKALLIALAAGSAITPQIAHAADEAITFKLKAIELESADSREKLLVRIKSKAKSECMARSSAFSFDAFACRKDLEAQWIAAIRNPALAALVNKDKRSMAIAAE